jgi:hypothetical protein
MMDNKQDVLKAAHTKAVADLAKHERAHAIAEKAYTRAVEGGDRVSLAKATKARTESANSLHQARVREAECRALSGAQEQAPDNLRHQTGRYS